MAVEAKLAPQEEKLKKKRKGNSTSSFCVPKKSVWVLCPHYIVESENSSAIGCSGVFELVDWEERGEREGSIGDTAAS